MIPRGFITSLLSLSLLFAVTVCGALLAVSLFFDDVNKVNAEWIEKNWSIPCTHLALNNATFDVDLNISTLELDAPPPDAFWESLPSLGWHLVQRNGLTLGTKDDLLLEYHDDNAHITMRLRPRLRHRQAPIPPASR